MEKKSKISKYLLALAIIIFSLTILTFSNTRIHAENISIISQINETTRTLKLTIPRTKGDDVKALQTFLNSKGYNTGTIDGIFGPKTQEQVKLFQKANNLTPDGSVGPKTKVFINNTSPTTSQPTLGCNPGASFNIFTGKSCKDTQPLVLPAGCTPNALFSTTTGVSCITGLPNPPVFKIISGVINVQREQAINTPTIAGVTIPAQGETPVSTLTDTTQYTATITWTGTPVVFIASTSYTANITLTPKSGYTLTGVTENFFTVAGATATNTANSGVITAVFPSTPLKQLTISSPTITTSKAYDGDTTANVTIGTLSGVSDGETVTVSATATYDDKNVGTNKDITVIYTLGGADASHYIKPADYTISTGEITVIPLTISSPTITLSKEYDNNTTANVTEGSLSGVISGDTVTVSAVANYNNTNVGTDKDITVVYTLDGIDSSNYTKPINYTVSTGIITQKQLTIGSPTITLSKEYDTNTTANVTAGTLSGIIPTEDVSISSTVATYDNANVGTGKTITVVYSITGTNATNYIKPINYTVSTGIITAVQLTVSNPTLTTSKTYDGDTTANVTEGTLSGVISGDTVTVSAVATYDNANVGTGKTITTVYTLGGASASNYVKPINYTVSTGEITPILINDPVVGGITIPFTDEIPVTSVTETDEYTGIVTWSGSPTTFDPLIVYTATITLTPKTGYTLTGVTENFFTVSGATSVTNSINSGVVSAVFPATVQLPATTPTSITFAVGSTAPVGGVTNVAIPAAGGTDTTGVITGYVATTADKIKFTVIDGGSATSTITINGNTYTSGTDYQVVPTSSLPTVVVTTTETGKITGVRTFIITGPILGQDGLTYGIVIGADGKKWLDRNLGATRVATSYFDYLSYGSLFQWGRAADGHQLINHTSYNTATAVNGNTTVLSTTDTPGHSNFIRPSLSPQDWRDPQNSNLWQGVNGVNNVCPAGFRLPTPSDWTTLFSAAGITNQLTAYSSSLKLPSAGGRNYTSSIFNLSSEGYYWSSGTHTTGSSLMYFQASVAYPSMSPMQRAGGWSVRCIKD